MASRAASIGCFEEFSLSFLWLMALAQAPDALLRHFGTPKFICMLRRNSPASRIGAGLKRRNAFLDRWSPPATPADSGCTATRCVRRRERFCAEHWDESQGRTKMFDVTKCIPKNDADDETARPAGGTLIERLADAEGQRNPSAARLRPSPASAQILLLSASDSGVVPSWVADEALAQARSPRQLTVNGRVDRQAIGRESIGDESIDRSRHHARAVLVASVASAPPMGACPAPPASRSGAIVNLHLAKFFWRLYARSQTID
jgi:hypothetical protein